MKYFINIDSVIAKTEELKKVGDKPGHPFRGNQHTGGGGKGKVKGASGRGVGSIPSGGSKKSLDRAKKKQKVRAERQKVQSESREVLTRGTIPQQEAYYNTFMRGLPSRGGAMQHSIAVTRHKSAMTAARKAGFKSGQEGPSKSVKRPNVKSSGGRKVSGQGPLLRRPATPTSLQ